MPSQTAGPVTEKFPKVPGTASVSCLFTWLGTKGDYAGLEAKSKKVTGWRVYTSSLTTQGRVNIVLATYLACGITGYLLWNSYKKKKAVTASEST
ncbi:hypothetical protein BaRGS_00001504 [Batillaria attramentaria]|uniref:Uncharacterized protein n=1 Tax=Batillaria attramentaria TaxID=370345 RepID=A0ABD0M713_9CAEN